MIDCVTLSTVHQFDGNPLYEHHRLRYRSIIERQGWNVPTVRDMEYDQYDNPAAYYLVWRDAAGVARGTSRLYPTDRPYMLQEVFAGLVTRAPLPASPSVWEGSRFCVDASLPPAERKRIIQELVVGYLEFAQAFGVREIVGVMYPIYWRNIFVQAGWDVTWIGEPQKSEEGHTIVAGSLPIAQSTLATVRHRTGFNAPVLSFGRADARSIIAQAA